MRRFVHAKTIKRYVSMVPGPLEARKRATKRRIVSIAQVGGGGGLDQAILQGLDGIAERRDWQWQSPKIPEERTPKGTASFKWSMAYSRTNLGAEVAPLPKWLTEFESTRQDDDRMTKKVDAHAQQFRMPKLLKPDSGFLDRLGSCRSSESVCSWATEHNIELRKYSRLAFRQLVKERISLPDLIIALDIPALDTSGNRKYFLENQLRRPLTEEDADALRAWIKNRTSLGSCSEAEILNVAILISESPELKDNGELRTNLANAIFEGLQSSTILGLQDVNNQILIVLLQSIAQGTMTSDSMTLGMEILEALQTSRLSQLRDNIPTFFQASFRAQAILQERKKRVPHLDFVSRSLKLLCSLPDDVVHDTILATLVAISDIRSDPLIDPQVLAELLDLWWSILAKSNTFDFQTQRRARSRIERFLEHQPLKYLALYLRYLDDEGKAEYVLQHWVVSKLRSDAQRRAVGRFTRLCRMREDETPFLHLLRIARDTGQLSGEMIQRVFNLLQMLQMPATIADILVSSGTYRFAINETIVLQTIRKHFESRPRIVLRIFKACTQLRLDRCPDLVHRLISDPHTHPNAPMELYHSRKCYSVSEADPQGFESMRQARARLLATMALAYSEALHLTPRMAFRRVYRCYRCIIDKHLGELPVDLAHAFVKAGIIRPLQMGEWVSTAKHRWILSFVRQLESPEEADKLDLLVYQWRGAVAEGNTKRSQPGLGEEDTIAFGMRTQWSKHWSRYQKVMIPLRRPGPSYRRISVR